MLTGTLPFGVQQLEPPKAVTLQAVRLPLAAVKVTVALPSRKGEALGVVPGETLHPWSAQLAGPLAVI